MRKILFGCFEVPGWGGLTTATYRLFETMLGDGFDVHYLNLIPDEERGRFRELFGSGYENPRGLPNVHTCNLMAPLDEPHPELAEFLEDLEPDLMVGVGDIAAFLMKRAWPGTKLVFLTAGCQQVDKLTPFTEQRLGANGPGTRESPDWKERGAVIRSDLILAHSQVTRDVYEAFYPEHAAKIHPEVIWFAEWIRQDAAAHSRSILPFEERAIDALFVANTWTREEKNYELVKRIVARLNGSSVHVVGEVPEEVPSVTHHGILGERSDLFRVMGNARAVVCPSSFDTAPGVLFEASAMGCNLIASRNCGNWFLCNDALLADPFTADTFAEKIRLARTRRFPDNMERFVRSNSYGKLTRILQTLE